MTQYVELFHCPDLRARITRKTCDVNKERLAWAQRKSAARGVGGWEASCVARELACCQGCPGVEARAWAAGMKPNVLALEPPEPRPPEERPSSWAKCEQCGDPFPVRGNKLYCSRRCNDAAKWKRRRARGWTSNRRSA